MGVADGGMERTGKTFDCISNDRLNSHAISDQLPAFYLEGVPLLSNESHSFQC